MPRFAVSATALVSLLAASLVNAASEVGSPNLFECSPAAILYMCDKTPCQIIARPADDPSTSLENFGSVSDATGTVSWKPVNQAAGTVVVLYITNADGEQATSAKLTVNSPNDSSNTLGSDGTCAGSGSATDASSSSSSTDASGSATSSAGSAATSVTSTAGSAASDASSKASDAKESVTSKAETATSDATAAAEASPTGESGAAGVFVKTSVVALAGLVAGLALF
ncbi:hypothetical protein JCM10212_004963 [Sporobolomyces blumeae]